MTLCQIPPVPFKAWAGATAAVFLQQWFLRAEVQCGCKSGSDARAYGSQAHLQAGLCACFCFELKGEMEVNGNHVYLGNMNFSRGPQTEGPQVVSVGQVQETGLYLGPRLWDRPPAWQKAKLQASTVWVLMGELISQVPAESCEWWVVLPSLFTQVRANIARSDLQASVKSILSWPRFL